MVNQVQHQELAPFGARGVVAVVEFVRAYLVDYEIALLPPRAFAMASKGSITGRAHVPRAKPRAWAQEAVVLRIAR